MPCRKFQLRPTKSITSSFVITFSHIRGKTYGKYVQFRFPFRVPFRVLQRPVSCTRVRSKFTYEEDWLGEPLSTAPVPCTPCDERCSVQCPCCNAGVLYVVTTGMACSDSNMTLLLWSVHVHIVSALYRILASSFCFTDCLYPSQQGMPYRTN